MANMNVNTDNLKVKRKRSANWDSLEKNLLKSCMKEFVCIIENKNTDTNTNKIKKAAWQTVTQRFIELNGRDRELSEIKQQWRTMKLDAKKNMSQIKTSMQQTGGGPKPPSPNPDTVDILNMIPQEFETDCNVFDSDGIATKKEESQLMDVQEFVLTPVNDTEIAEENITPVSINMKSKDIYESCRTKRKLPFNEENKPRRLGTESNNERNKVLISCLKEEHDLKLKNMMEAHQFTKEEHNLKIQQLLVAHSLFKEKTQLEIEKLKLEMLVLKRKLCNESNENKY